MNGVYLSSNLLPLERISVTIYIEDEKSQLIHSAHCMSLVTDTFFVRCFVNVEIKSKAYRK